MKYILLPILKFIYSIILSLTYGIIVQLVKIILSIILLIWNFDNPDDLWFEYTVDEKDVWGNWLDNNQFISIYFEPERKYSYHFFKSVFHYIWNIK